MGKEREKTFVQLPQTVLSPEDAPLSIDNEERRYIHPFYHIMRGHTFSEASRPQGGASRARSGEQNASQ